MARWNRLLAAAVVVAGALAAGCAPGGAPPPSDACNTPTPGHVDAVALGAASAEDLAGAATAFVALADGDGVPMIRGPQGANMIGVVLQLAGGAAPTCLMQRTVVAASDGAKIASGVAPLRTYLQPDGTRLTHPLWLPAEYPLQFTVSVDAADQSLSRHLHLLVAQ